MGSPTTTLKHFPIQVLSELEIEKVNGGTGLLVPAAAVIGVVTGAVALFNAAETAGRSIGKALYNITH